jgi:hypothetical protein
MSKITMATLVGRGPNENQVPVLDYTQVPLIRQVYEKHGEIEGGLVEIALPVLQALYPKLPKKYRELYDNPGSLNMKNYNRLVGAAYLFADRHQKTVLNTSTSHFAHFKDLKYDMGVLV